MTRLRWERLAMAALVLAACWWGGRAIRAVATSARPFEHASRASLFAYGLFTLYGSPHTTFLYRVHALVGHDRVLLSLPNECPSRSGPIVTNDGWGLVYSLAPATVTCDPADADFELVFGRADPARAGRPLVADDADHALYRLRP